MDVGSWQMIAGLVVGICVLVGLILYSRIHAFPALIIAAIVTGLVGGMPFSKVIASVTKGFGGTLGSIGIINWGGILACGVIVTIPVILLFAFVQRYLIEGLTAGAVKG